MPEISHLKANQSRGQDTKELLMKTAILRFTTIGYDASSTRKIETDAGVKRGLITYHFGTKRDFWKASIQWMLDQFSDEFAEALKAAQNVESHERLRYLIRTYVQYCARHPEMHRLMALEGAEKSWRLKWLVEHRVSDWYKLVEGVFNEAKKMGLAPKMEFYHFYYIMVGAASLIFSMAPESKLIAGIDPMTEETATKHADALAEILFPTKDIA